MVSQKRYGREMLPLYLYVYKVKKNTDSCEIAGFVEAHLCKLCVILRSRVLRILYGPAQEIPPVHEEIYLLIELAPRTVV